MAPKLVLVHRGKEEAMAIEPQEVVRRYFDEVHNGRKLDLIDQLVAPNYKENNPLPGQGSGPEGLKARERMLAGTLDVRFTLEDLIADGDKVVARWRNHGKHIGEFLGIPPTGKEFSVEGINIYRVQNGKIAEGWNVVDVFGQLMQLGVIPAPQESRA
jgi:predicted ester cyclase